MSAMNEMEWIGGERTRREAFRWLLQLWSHVWGPSRGLRGAK